MPAPALGRLPWKPVVFVVCLLPLAALAFDGVTDALGANPIERIDRVLGDWALRFLVFGLATTPARRLLGWSWAPRYRRMLGLFAFFYAVLHVANYVVIDRFFAWDEIGADIVKRKFITVGILTLALLVPLAATSTAAMIRRLGGARWRRLHRIVYGAAALAVLHYFMMVKVDATQPVVYGVVLAVLLGMRLLPPRDQKEGRALPRARQRLVPGPH